jgi:hypothetical protein
MLANALFSSLKHTSGSFPKILYKGLETAIGGDHWHPPLEQRSSEPIPAECYNSAMRLPNHQRRVDPTPEQIRQECQAIQQRWSSREYHSRLACDATRQAIQRGWVIPVIECERSDEAVDALWRE